MTKYNNTFTNERIFEQRGAWYFHTREGIEGPYQNQFQAKHKLDAYLGIFGNLELTDVRVLKKGKPSLTLIPTHMQWR